MIRFVNTPGADALTPPSGRTVVFVDDTGVPAYKDSSGVVHSLQGTDGTGVPAGGTTGQVLRKTDNTDYNTEWHTLGTAAEEDASSFVLASQLGVSVAQLVGGTVPAGQLPSYVDDVLEFANVAAFPTTGETGKIYIALDTNRQYRWSGSTYTQLVASPGTTDNVPEGTTNLYFTASRAAAAAPVQSVNGQTGVVDITADSLGAVKTTGDQSVAGIKTFTGTNLRIQSGAPAFWLDEVGGTFGMLAVLDADILQFQVRPSGFVNTIVDIPFRIEMATKVITTDYLVRPRTTNKDDLGTGTFRYKKLWCTEFDVGGTAAQKEASRRSIGLPITVSATAPASPSEGDVWIDIS